MRDMVVVNLTQRRGYRAQQSDREAIWVGPGEVEVPRWVAERWGLEPAAPAAETAESVVPAAKMPESSLPKVELPDTPGYQPWADYDDQSAPDIVRQIPGLSATQRAIVAAYEQRHKNRLTILDALGVPRVQEG